SGTTAPTFPGGDPIPTSGSQDSTGPFGLPSAGEILRRKRESDRNRYPNPDPNSDPNRRLPEPPDRVPEKRVPGVPGSQPESIPGSTTRRTGPDDSISRMLDLAYATADQYLETLAEKSGGRLLRADTISSLPDAFARIAAELRTQ